MAGLRGFRASLAVLELQFQSLGTVAGIAAFTPGYLAVSCPGWSGDPSPIVSGSAEQFFNELWSTAVNRLEEHARKIGADGVIGVTVSYRSLGVGQELQVSGTAFRHAGVEPLPTPFLSALPMRDFLTLLAAGWIPCGIAWGHAGVHVHGYASSPYWQGVQYQNAEMPVPTEAVNLARSRAEAAVQASAQNTGARGVVGMTIDIQRQVQNCWRSRSNTPGMLVLAHAVGTGIARYRDTGVPITPTRRLTTKARA